MTIREQRTRERPDFPWLDPADVPGLRRFLVARGWLAGDEEIVACGSAGAGNMNLTLRVVTSARSLIVKQARPWVERYDHIAAPPERSDLERRFYRRVRAIPAVAERMPRLLAWDADARVLVLEDLGTAHDCSGLYGGDRLAPRDLDELAAYLRALHDGTRAEPDPSFANRAMRALNHAHIFEIPLDVENGVDLEPREPGLAAVAATLRRDAEYRTLVAATGRRYLEDGTCLLHGDYFPGSWLRTAAGIRVIDPEFCFYGDPELDVGCAVAHLVLAEAGAPAVHGLLAGYQAAGALDPSLLARYAAVEIMRRLLGVAQLPIAPTTGRRATLVACSREAMLRGSMDPLFG